ncbi:hypothetical protein [Breznakiella homolactica]|uniref:Uncharacterized protein n=1 Tax=Breznakiella homolactica TaxID=2798577 RepID=A0A7T7XLU0_9SPIR|nr:hypothetical protein [Breznakiella homolactica]QQO08731.1 hypothetical protein JFL75_17660 [Breznakiella homolactica]
MEKGKIFKKIIVAVSAAAAALALAACGSGEMEQVSQPAELSGSGYDVSAPKDLDSVYSGALPQDNGTVTEESEENKENEENPAAP